MSVLAEYQPVWFKDGACSGSDPALFFPEQGTNTHAHADMAKAVCATCPVQPQCLEYALGLPDDTVGVFGGTTRLDRQNIRRKAQRVDSSRTLSTMEA